MFPTAPCETLVADSNLHPVLNSVAAVVCPRLLEHRNPRICWYHACAQPTSKVFGAIVGRTVAKDKIARDNELSSLIDLLNVVRKYTSCRVSCLGFGPASASAVIVSNPNPPLFSSSKWRRVGSDAPSKRRLLCRHL